MKNTLFSILKFAIGWPLSIVAFLFIIKIFWDQAPALLPNLENINYSLLFLGVLSLMIYYFVRSVLWYRILSNFLYKIPFRESMYLWAMTEAKRYIPGKVWMVLGRAVMFGKFGVEKKDIGKGLLIEAALFTMGSLVVALLSLPYFFSSSLLVSSIAGLLVILIVIIYAFNRSIIHFLPQKFKKVHTFFHFLLPQFSPTENIRLVGISAAGLFFFGLGNYLIISAASLLDPQQVFQLVGVFVLAFLVGFLSIITPSGLGVREVVLLYGLMKVTTEGFAAFAALFSRVMLIVSEVMFICIAYLVRVTKQRFIRTIFAWIRKHPQVTIVIGLALMYAIYISSASMLRHDNYYTGRFDLGNMVQTVWNTLHGRIFLFTNPDGTEIVSRLAFHADFILILLAPFYALWQDPRMLLLIQSIVIAIGALYVYAIARDVLKSKNLGVIFAFAYLINPSIERANLYDFHGVVLATTFLLAAFYYILKKQWLLFTLFLFLAGITKEEVWLICALMGLFVTIWYKKYLLGSSIFIIGLAAFYYLVSVAIPNASPESEHFALSYFTAFGNSPAEVLQTIFFSPEVVWQTIWTPTRIDYLVQIFSPYGYLSFAFPFFLIFAGPALGINLLSSNAQLHQIYYQYTATISPFIIICAIYGMWVLQQIAKRTISAKHNVLFHGIVGGYLIFSAMYAAYLYGPLPGGRWSNLEMFTKPLINRTYVDAYLANIPYDYKVAASNNLGAHIMHRDYVYTVPIGVENADLIVLMLIEDHSRMTYEKLSTDSAYIQIAQDDNFVAFQRK